MDLPSEPTLRDLVRRVASLRVRLAEELGDRPLVLPNAEYFPDRFVGDGPSLQRLVGRMQRHAGMSDVPIAVTHADPDAEPNEAASANHGCTSGACGAGATETPGLLDTGDGWLIQVPQPEISHHVALTTNLARSLGTIFLEETRGELTSIETPFEVTTDLATVALGFGVLALQGAHIYQKSCGGPSIARLTALGPAELAVAVALFAHVGGHSLRPALKLLEPTQREALSEARAFVSSNEALIFNLKTRPDRLLDGAFELRESRSVLGRFFTAKGRARAKDWDAISPEASLEELESAIALAQTNSWNGAETPRPDARGKTGSKLRSKEDEELRRLVAEALDEETGSARVPNA